MIMVHSISYAVIFALLSLFNVGTVRQIREKRTISEVLSKWIFKEKCMGDLGCFNTGPPFFDIVQRPISLLPNEREEVGTMFRLYTASNPRIPKNFSTTSASKHPAMLLQSAGPARPGLKTIVVVAGFMSQIDAPWQVPMKDAFLQTGGLYNVFVVDWSGGDGPIYEQAVANTRVVGAEVAQFVRILQKATGIKPETVHIIGHSLGAHIAGYAGKRIRNLGRITGMDPAGPYFENVDPKVRLSAGDAILVDNIHTNSATNRFEGFGTTESIGHLDFFPNGGSLQPGCPNLGSALWDFIKNPSIKESKEMDELICNHHRAINLMIASIKRSECGLKAVACDTWNSFVQGRCGSCDKNSSDIHVMCVEMGLHADRHLPYVRYGSSLKLFLNTSATEPFCPM